MIGEAAEVRLSTSKGYLLLPLDKLDESQRQLLRNIRPFECLVVRSSEPFDMTQREVRFTEFKLKKLHQTDAECRKIQLSTRIYGS